jgi:two-component system LytT family response regulator
MSKLRVAIADDEAVARKRLVRLLSELPDVEVVLACESADALLAELEAVEPDLLVLDIQMPGMTGLELQAKLGADAPYVIYATAHPEHAIDAYDAGAVDYVLKPVDASRLERAIARARGLLERANTPLGALGALPRGTRIAVEVRDGILLLSPERMSHASFDGQLVTLHLDDKDVVSDRTLAELEAQLAPHGFERVHRRFLLNLHRVARLEDEASGGYTAHCDSGAKVAVSRQVARQLRRRLLG